MQVQDRVFVVTGGGNGIGREVVIRLLGEGGKVAAVDLRAEALGAAVAGRSGPAEHARVRRQRRGAVRATDLIAKKMASLIEK